MTISIVSQDVAGDSRSGSPIAVHWSRPSATRHEFLAAACPDDEGGYSVFALHLPGVVSQGETVEEAKANIQEAFLAMLEARRARGESLEVSPLPVVPVTPECTRFWATVHG